MEEFERKGMVARVDGNQDVDAVFRDVRAGLRSAQEREVLDVHKAAVEALSRGNLTAYAEVRVCAGGRARIQIAYSVLRGTIWSWFIIVD